MNKIKEHAALAAVVIMLSGLFLLMPDTVSEATVGALSLCALRVIPSVFPYSVLSSLFVSAGGADSLDRAMSPLSKRLFGTAHGASALVLGLLFGFPLGALTVGVQHRAGTLTTNEASRMLAFVCCASPTFPVFVVGRGYFGSTAVGLAIWGTQAAVSVLTGAILSHTHHNSGNSHAVRHAASTDASVSALITGALTDASRVMLNVCGSVAFFSILSAVISRLLGAVTDSALPSLLISAAFEFSSGTAAAAEACSAGLVSRAAAVGICGFSVGFAGLSVMFQTASVCDDTPLSAHICGKLICGAVTAAVTYAVSEYPAFAPVFSSADTQTVRYNASAFALSVPAVLLAVFLIYLFYKNTCKNERGGV